MLLSQGMPIERPLFLGADKVDLPAPAVFLSKNCAPFRPAFHPLRPFGLGWWALQLTSDEVDEVGTLAYRISQAPVLGEPVDQVLPVTSFPVDRTALLIAVNDLANGFAAGQTLQQLLQRPVYNFLQSLM